MEKLRQLAMRAANLNQDQILETVLKSPQTEKEAVRLNTIEQLYKGVDATGQDLRGIGGDYTPLTKLRKRAKGQPVDRVTLRDTGRFYKSFRLVVKKQAFQLTANFIKDGTDLRRRWGQNLAGFTQPSLQKFRSYLKPLIRDEFVRSIHDR